MIKVCLGCLSKKWSDSQSNKDYFFHTSKTLPFQMADPQFWSILDSTAFNIHPKNNSWPFSFSTSVGPANADGYPPGDQFLSQILTLRGLLPVNGTEVEQLILCKKKKGSEQCFKGLELELSLKVSTYSAQHNDDHRVQEEKARTQESDCTCLHPGCVACQLWVLTSGDSNRNFFTGLLLELNHLTLASVYT